MNVGPPSGALQPAPPATPVPTASGKLGRARVGPAMIHQHTDACEKPGSKRLERCQAGHAPERPSPHIGQGQTEIVAASPRPMLSGLADNQTQVEACSTTLLQDRGTRPGRWPNASLEQALAPSTAM